MNKKLINIIESYKKSNLNKIRLSYKLKDYYNLNNQNMIDREEIYNEVIQNYSELQYKYQGDELQDKINEIVDKIIENE